ncbi:hypothetical protein A9Q86_00720 [Flavobacteriales bacterium 33_180_T64]|nr:hypothetical protein A9Q86_00720 [Flavobacteriales bacterium 33_180_T64]
MNISKFRFLLLLIFATSCAYDLDDNLDIDPNVRIQDIISADSDLFNNLKEISNTDEQPNNSIVCIDFIYPLTLFTFDENNTYVSTTTIVNDQQFSSFLEAIDISHAISMSFPITSTLESGEYFIINNKEELKEAIDSCLSEELVYECGELIQNCVWKVGYSYNDDNLYLGSIFQESDGLTTLNIDNSILNGSWSPFIIENELHININLNDTTELGEYFNLDWKVEYLDENTLLLTNLERALILNQRCDPDFADCGNFIFEACETNLDSGISEFILEDYVPCIFDTLELDDEFEIYFYETEADATTLTNPILPNEPYENIENNQIIYIIIDDIENDMQYYVLITLSAISC